MSASTEERKTTFNLWWRQHEFFRSDTYEGIEEAKWKALT